MCTIVYISGDGLCRRLHSMRVKRLAVGNFWQFLGGTLLTERALYEQQPPKNYGMAVTRAHRVPFQIYL